VPLLLALFAAAFVAMSFMYDPSSDAQVASLYYRTVWGGTELAALAFIVLRLRQLRGQPPLISVVCLWLLWMPVSCIQLLEWGTAAVITGLVQVLYCPLFMLFFYLLVKQRPRWFAIIQPVFLLLLLFTSLLFFRNIREAAATNAAAYAPRIEAYFVLLLLPWVLVSRRALIQYGGTTLVAIVMFWAMKRAGVIAFAAASGVYFVAFRMRSRRRQNLRWVVGIVSVGLLLLFAFRYVSEESGGFLLSRFEAMNDDRGSGRLDIYLDALHLQATAPLYNWILGHGHNAVQLSGQIWVWFEACSAHNDWQEVLFDYGLPGFALYLALHGILLGQTRTLLIRDSRFGPAMAASYALFFVLSFVSHLVLYPTYFAYLMAFWGAVTAMSECQVPGNDTARGYRPRMRNA
jgi:hypothetical protein